MAGTILKKEDYSDGGIRYIRWLCTASSDGDVTTTSSSCMAGDVRGVISNVKWTPDDSGGLVFSGNNVPAAGWDGKLLCSQYSATQGQVFGLTHDVANGLGTNLSTAAPKQGMPVDPTNGGPYYLFGNRLKPWSSGTGNAKKYILEAIIQELA